MDAAKENAVVRKIDAGKENAVVRKMDAPGWVYEEKILILNSEFSGNSYIMAKYLIS